MVIINNQFIVKNIDEKINIDIPNINVVNRDYIKDLYSMHANKDMDKRVNKLLSGQFFYHYGWIYSLCISKFKIIFLN